MKRLMRCMAVAVIVLFQAWDTASGEEPRNIDEEIKATWTSVFNGHLNDAIARATKLLSEIDPAQDGDGYWRASSSLVEILQELENDTLADKMLGVMVQKKIAENQPLRRPWMQYYLGRDLVRLGHQQEGEQILKSLVGGGDERQVYFPAQRSAAIFVSKIEYDRGNIDQSAIWMRRAVIGILINKDAASIDILDILMEYAAHLALTRRPLDALALYARLEPIYRVGTQKHSPKYIRFMAQYLQTLTTVGAYAVADRTLAELKEAVKGVDILPPSITEILFSQDLYQAARSVPETGPNPVIERLKKLTADYPDFLKSPGFRVAFSYFALLAGDFQLADEYARASKPEQSENAQIRAYDLLLQSLAAAGKKDFPRSLRLAREGVEQIHLFLREFEPLSSNWSPALRSEERVVLGAILGVNAEKPTNAEDKNTLFDIAQLLNSDRSKLGLTARISRQALKLDLQREDLRTRDRLRDVRDRLMDEAVRTLITRIVTPPKKEQSSPQTADTSPMQRLEEIEDKIVIADQQTQNVYKHISQKILTEIEDVRDILRPDEALVLHNITPLGIAQACIVGDGVFFHFEPLPIDKAKQVGIDEKLILAAVHAEYAPSWSGSASPSPSKLVINLVSPTGELLSRREYVVADRALSSAPPGLVVKGKNDDLIVVINKQRTFAEEKLPGWVINPFTGSHRFCFLGNMTTFLDIDIDTLKIRSTADTHDRVAKALKTHDGEIFVVFSTARECRLQHGIELAKLNGALQPETVFKYEGVNDIELWDFVPLEKSFVLSGSVRVQLPTTLLREVIPLGQLTSAFDPAFWERGEERPNAFVLIVSAADGTVLGDRVFPDLLNRSINRVVASGPRQIVGVGAALGDRGWMVVLKPSAPIADRAGATSPIELQH